MNKHLATEQGLINYTLAIDPTIPVDYPNHELGTYPVNQPWLQLSNLRAGTFLVTLGASGENEDRGILQIDFNAPKNTGSGLILALADKYEKSFPIGKKIPYNNGNLFLTVHKTALSAGRYVGNYYRVSLSIDYSYRTARNLT
nr:hypothetical protein 3 [Moraxellaceae bacterium]